MPCLPLISLPSPKDSPGNHAPKTQPRNTPPLCKGARRYFLRRFSRHRAWQGTGLSGAPYDLLDNGHPDAAPRPLRSQHIPASLLRAVCPAKIPLPLCSCDQKHFASVHPADVPFLLQFYHPRHSKPISLTSRCSRAVRDSAVTCFHVGWAGWVRTLSPRPPHRAYTGWVIVKSL